MSAPPSAAPARATGVAMILASAVVWPCMDAVAKHLAAAGYPTTQIAWGRYAANVLLLAPLVLARHGPRALLPPLRGLHLVRVALPVGVTVLLFYGFAHMPFAEASALLFVNPLLITAASGPALGERVGLSRWLAVAAGFAGALLVIRPGSGLFTWASLSPLGAAACFAASVILNRKLKGDVPALATTLHFGVVASVGLLPLAAAGGWRAFDATFVGWLALMAVFGGLALWLITAGYERAEASFLAPFHYVELACATAIGVLVFGEVPDAVAASGIALILGAGLWVALRR
ncbi:MAG TPA: DMT family transporter [Anaeromyxobacteraceae bacterium]|nr:DMT family transporter [Anaeromyxobacteraceae bacterium]